MCLYVWQLTLIECMCWRVYLFMLSMIKFSRLLYTCFLGYLCFCIYPCRSMHACIHDWKLPFEYKLCKCHILSYGAHNQAKKVNCLSFCVSLWYVHAHIHALMQTYECIVLFVPPHVHKRTILNSETPCGHSKNKISLLSGTHMGCIIRRIIVGWCEV